MKLVCFLLLAAFVGLSHIEANTRPAGGPFATPQAEPKDIRDIFLTLPIPDNVDSRFSESLADSASRKRLLQQTDFSSAKSILD
ncbi:MAG: hypothetical protein ACREDR_10715, partial [Blastocatellia bacterium]